jgi:hypothetical protein
MICNNLESGDGAVVKKGTATCTMGPRRTGGPERTSSRRGRKLPRPNAARSRGGRDGRGVGFTPPLPSGWRARQITGDVRPRASRRRHPPFGAEFGISGEYGIAVHPQEGGHGPTSGQRLTRMQPSRLDGRHDSTNQLEILRLIGVAIERQREFPGAGRHGVLRWTTRSSGGAQGDRRRKTADAATRIVVTND